MIFDHYQFYFVSLLQNLHLLNKSGFLIQSIFQYSEEKGRS